MSDTSEAQPGQRVGRYRIVDRLGAGGMGIVYRAIDTGSTEGTEDNEGASGREIALKLLRPAHLADEERRKRFLREARLAAALDHPGIVRVLEVGEADGNIFLAMELVKGQSLRAWMSRPRADGALPSVDEVLTITAAIASAVASAHAKGVVHRDLKPENVMIEDGLRVRVLDFGLAKLREVEGGALYEAETETNLTSDGRVLGTPGYMAPEQAAGKEVGLRADVFALGAILDEMLTGARTFTGDSPMDILVSLSRDEPPPPSTINAAVGPALDALVARCLSKDAARRPSMQELSVALARPALRDPMTAAASTPSSPRRSLRHLGRLGAASAIVAVAALAFVAARASAPSSPAATASAPSSMASAKPVTVLDLPLPPSAIPEALLAYRKAIDEEHQGAEDAALLDLERATELDPELAAAHLRLSYRLAFTEADRARTHFAQAVRGRERLSPRDREFLEAVQPLLQGVPADMDETQRRIEALSARYPSDVELVYEVAQTRNILGDFAGSEAAGRRAVELDPGFGLAWAALAEVQAYRGSFAASRATVERCLAVTPSASWCMWVTEFIDGQEGHCEAAEASARRRIVVDPTIPDGYKALAFALGALGRPPEVIREAIDQAVQRVADPFGQRRLFLNLNTRLDLFIGDFASALAHSDALRAHVATRSDISDHASATNFSAELQREIGHPERAALIAKSFLDRREAWHANPIVHDYALADDMTPTIASFAFHGGAMAKPEYEGLLDAWRAKWNRGLRGDYRPYLWVYGYTTVVETAAEAAGALEARDRYAPIPPFIPNGAMPNATVGRTLWLGGREEEGLRYLRLAAGQCTAIMRPVMWIRAHAWLAEALAKSGDTAGACKALDVVIAHWGASKPRSVTAEAALGKSRQLGCARSPR